MAAAQLSEHRSVVLRKPLNGWRLFSLIVIPMSVAVLYRMSQADLSAAADISAMVTYSVRLAVPWLFVAFAASAVLVLFRGSFGRWLMKNRKYIGLAYAAGMAWQLFFIVWLVVGHTDYYLSESYSLIALAEQVPGYLFLIAMTVTSFRFGRSRLSAGQWRLLHLVGIYWLWAVTWSTYWYELFYYDDRQLVDYAYYWAGFGAWGLRIAAWTKKRLPAPMAQTAG